jgi:proline-specific peptidase
MLSEENYLDFKGYKTWYKVYGDLTSEMPTLIVLHGGPGYPHDHLQNLSELAKNGYAVVLYDQLGCGKSDRPDNPDLWTIGLFIEELTTLRSELDLENINLLGHSWGGSLAAEYLFTKPQGVNKLVLSSPLLDTSLWVEEADKLKDLLPPEVAATMRKHEHDGTTETQDYKDAYSVFRDNFLCRVKPYPEMMKLADDGAGDQVYNVMWGPSEAFATGTLKGWSALDRLNELTLPTLLLSGKYDEATPKQMEVAHNKLHNSEWVMFENSSHTSNIEEPGKYLQTVNDFLISATHK